MPRRLLCLLLAVILLAACSDSTAPDDEFAITIEVRDAAGDPVAGLRASLSPDIDDEYVHWPHRLKPADKPQTQVVIDLPEPSTVELRVDDVAGTRIWTEVREMVSGQVGIIWDGRDQQGEPVHDGWYEIGLTVTGEGSTEPDHVSTSPVLLITGSPDVVSCGTTDAAGRLVVTDRTYVPGFWNPEPIVVRDEEGEVVGEIVLTPATRLVLLDDQGQSLTHVFEAADAPQTISLTWSP